jgi:uncharacterized membrane protein
MCHFLWHKHKSMKVHTKSFSGLVLVKNIIRIVMGVMFIGMSSLHFVAVETELKIIPEFLPFRRTALYLTGLWEIIGGIGLLIPRWKRVSAWSMVGLLLVVFPANIYHAITDIRSGRFAKTRFYHWIRFPFQAVFIWLVLWSTDVTRES